MNKNRIEELFYSQLEKEIKRSSKGKINKERRQLLAADFIRTFDFNNSAAQHKSVRGWADFVTQNYFAKIKA